MVAAERLIGRLRDDVAVNAAVRCLSELALQPFRIQLGSHSVASLTWLFELRRGRYTTRLLWVIYAGVLRRDLAAQ